jgi:hypothetical protein
VTQKQKSDKEKISKTEISSSKKEITENDLKFLFFCDFGKNVKDKENRFYEEVKDLGKLKQVRRFLKKFNKK